MGYDNQDSEQPDMVEGFTDDPLVQISSVHTVVKDSDNFNDGFATLVEQLNEEGEDSSHEEKTGLNADPSDLEYDPGRNYYRQKQRQRKKSIEEGDFQSISITRVTTTEHNSANNANEVVECSVCSFTTSEKRLLTLHIKKMHLDKYPCDQCNFVGNSKQSLNYHRNSTHNGVRKGVFRLDFFSFNQSTAGLDADRFADYAIQVP